VFGGNCGFTIAPLLPQDGDYLMRMLARVEGMPLEALQTGVPWNWQSTAEYLDQLDGTLMPNAGFLVGHSAIRRVVMHEEATQRKATAAEVQRMCALLRDGLSAGGMGFSSTWSSSHNDHDGEPVPSRHASREEILALCSVVGEFQGRLLSFSPQLVSSLMKCETRSLTCRPQRTVPSIGTCCRVSAENDDHVEAQLSVAEHAKARGGRVIALTMPDTIRVRLNVIGGFVLDILHGWAKPMALALTLT
jgi:N-acyl-D-aspartate/D-glutamate deacylase